MNRHHYFSERKLKVLLVVQVCLLSFFLGTLKGVAGVEGGDVDPRFVALPVCGAINFTGSLPGRFIQKVIPLSDGRVLIAGDFRSLGDSNRWGIARLLPNGQVDASFEYDAISEGLLGVSVYDMAIDGRRRILMAGSSRSAGTFDYRSVWRLMEDGAVDRSFHVGSAVSQSVSSCLVLKSGLIVVGGIFDNYNGEVRRSLAWLNEDGVLLLKPTAAEGLLTELSSTPAEVRSLAEDPLGRVWVGGYFVKASGRAAPGLARYSASGEVDVTFAPSFRSAYVKSIVPLAGGGAFVTGTLTLTNGQQVRIVKMTDNGSIDPQFKPPHADLVENIRSIQVDSLGRILIGSRTTPAYLGSYQTIQRLLPGGAYDTSFRLKWPVDATRYVESIGLSPEGLIYVAAGTDAYDSLCTQGLMRLYADSPAGSGQALPNKAASPANGVGLAGVVPQPPRLLSLASDTRRIPSGETIKYSVSVTGTPPFSYQWFRADQPMDRENGSSLILPDVTVADSGMYRVRIRSSYGEVYGSPNYLWVQDPVDINEPLGTEGWKWLSGGARWISEDVPGALGGKELVYTVDPGRGAETGWIETRLTGPGKLTTSFTLELGLYSHFTAAGDGIYGGGANWFKAGHRSTQSLPSGNYVLRWQLEPAPLNCFLFNSPGQSCNEPVGCWIDAISFVPTTPAVPKILEGPFDTEVSDTTEKRLFVRVESQTPTRFQWWKDDQPIAGATRSALTLSARAGNVAGRYRVRVTNQNGAVDSRTSSVIQRPEVLPRFSGIAVAGPGRLALTLSSGAGKVLVLERSTDLRNWTILRVVGPVADPEVVEIENAQSQQFLRLSQ